MTLLEALVLGVVQGLTELLPVSSSGHLAIVPKVLGMDDPPLPFTVAVHVGTVVAVIVCFRRDIRDIAVGTNEPLIPLQRTGRLELRISLSAG